MNHGTGSFDLWFTAKCNHNYDNPRFYEGKVFVGARNTPNGERYHQEPGTVKYSGVTCYKLRGILPRLATGQAVFAKGADKVSGKCILDAVTLVPLTRYVSVQDDLVLGEEVDNPQPKNPNLSEEHTIENPEPGEATIMETTWVAEWSAEGVDGFASDGGGNVPEPPADYEELKESIRNLHTEMETLRQQTSIAAGTIAFFPKSAPPAGWLACDGRSLSASAYPKLYEAIGSSYGGNSTEFRLPDMRGQFVRSWDAGRGVDANRGIGTEQFDAIRNIVGKFAPTVPQNHASFVSGAVGAISTMGLHTTINNQPDKVTWGYEFDASRVVPVANENRPKNIAMLAMIKF